MGRTPCCSKEGLNRGAWTTSEDELLSGYIRDHGEGSWRSLPLKAGLKRCGKSCRLRWLNYLRPNIKRGNITHDEEELIIRLHKLLGNRWSLIAGRLPGRTDNEIKNYWNTNLVKKVGGQSASVATAHHHKRYQHSKESKFVNIIKAKSSVVRAKASRCTKVFFNPEIHSVNDKAFVGEARKHIFDESIFNDFSNSLRAGLEMNKEAVQSESHDRVFSFSLSGDENSSGFKVDLDAGELCFPEFLASDFPQLCDNANNKNDFLPSLYNQLLFSEESEPNWISEQC